MADPAREKAALKAALAKATPEGIVALLQQANPDLLRQLQEQAASAQLPQQTPTADAPAREQVGAQIGPYRLLQELGEGGMGTVFLAEQLHPVERRVALKIIKAGMDSRQVLARFEAEEQALAMMDHPNIAKVFDAGLTQAGRPYFVMELVKGIPITQYCDQEHLTPRERLELFIPVCQAVQHAHQKGVIHRDLKPSNVIVALYDGKPVPKVIDFGVAKATGAKLTERTMFTEVGQMVGTLEYMAPEQAELNNLDIDTRADIYSLGVLLYELLTGSPPFTSRELRSAAFDEMLRIIREVEPPKPSTKLSSSDELPAIAAKRKLEPQRLTKVVSGELDWIVMKCLEKDRTRRYETATGLATDIACYLHDEPVSAGPPSRAYRLRKFVGRNKVAMLTATTLTASLALGLLGTTYQAIRAKRAEQVAIVERNDKERALLEVRDRAEEQRQVNDLYQCLLFDCAIDAAFSGDTKQTVAAIEKARLAQAPLDMRQTVEGLSLLFGGREEEAVQKLKEVKTNNPASFLAHAALWSAYRYAADFGDMYQTEKSMRDLNLSPQSDYDRLFCYFMEVQVVPSERINEVIRSLDALIDSHERWGAAYAVRAVAWDESGREYRRLADLRQAIDDVSTARSILKDNPLILTVALSILTDGIEMARVEASNQDLQQWCAAGEEIRNKLEQDPTSFMGRREVTVFCHVTGTSPRYPLTEDDLIERDKGGPVVETVKWLREQNASKLEDLEKRLQQKPDDAESLTCRGLILAMKSDADREKAMSIFDRLLELEGKPANKTLALHIPLLAGRLDVVRNASVRILNSQVLSRTWRDWQRMTEYHARRIDEDELRLRAAPFGVLQQMYYHEIAMEALAAGNRRKAQDYFQKVVDTVQVGTWYYHSAVMFLARLQSDPTWPSWIHASSNG